MSRQTASTVGLPKGIRDETKPFALNPGSLPGVRARASDKTQRVIQQCVGTYTVTPSSWREVLGKVSRTGYVRIVFAPGDYQLSDGLDITQNGVQFVALTPGSARFVLDRPGTAVRGNIASVSGDDFFVSGFRVSDAVGTQHAFAVTGARATVERVVFEDCAGAVYLTGAGHTVRDCVILNSRTSIVVSLVNADNALVGGNRLFSGDLGYMNITANNTSGVCSLFGNVSEGGGGTLTYYTATGTVEAANAFTVSAL